MELFLYYYLCIYDITIVHMTGMVNFFPDRTGSKRFAEFVTECPAGAQRAGTGILLVEMMENESAELRPCRKCLLRDMKGQEEYFRSLREYIENLDMDIRASGPLYEDRIHVCRECGMLLEGMCRRCGCYVELRAAVLKNHCPDEKW